MLLRCAVLRAGISCEVLRVAGVVWLLRAGGVVCRSVCGCRESGARFDTM